MPDLFISHATADNAAVDQLTGALSAFGITAWVDHQNGILPGNPNWDQAIRTAITTCKAGVLVMSPRSLASPICAAECLLIRELNKDLYVAYLETCEAQTIWLFIKMIQYADLRSNFQAGVTALAQVLRGETAPNAPTPAHAKVTGAEVMHQTLPYLNTVPLTGREADIASLRALLGAHVTQLIAVGGTGKSRMAAELAREHPNGAIWHRCDEKNSAAYQLTDLVRRHYGLDEKTPPDVVLGALDRTPPLIIVDNAESISAKTTTRSEYVELMGRLTAHGAPVLLTSRVVWDELKPRKAYQPAPLTAEPAHQIALGFAAADAITLSPEEAETLAVAARLHPRLIEFAVRQLHEREFERVLRQLRELKQVDVQDALDEMILKTVRQMSEQVRGGADAERVLHQITVFRGSFDRAALLALKPDGMDEDTLDDALVVLQRWGFVQRDARGRFRIDDVVISAVGTTEDAERLHYLHFLSLYSDNDKNLRTEQHALITTDWDNIRAALVWGLSRNSKTLAWIFSLSLYMQTYIARADHTWLLRSALLVAELTGDQQAQGTANWSLALIAALISDYATSRTYATRAQSNYAAIQNEIGLADVDYLLSQIELLTGNLTAARNYLTSTLLVYERPNYVYGQANALMALGQLDLMTGSQMSAQAYFARALPLYESIDIQPGIATVLQLSGQAKHLLGDHADAVQLITRALALFETLGDRIGQANTLLLLGDIANVLGDYAQARAVLTRALHLFETLGARAGQAQTLRSFGIMLYHSGDPGARAYLEQALTLAETVNEKGTQANALVKLAEIARDAEDFAAARDYLQRALVIFAAIGDQLGEANGLETLAEVEAQEEHYDTAQMYLLRALTIFDAVHAPLTSKANALFILGYLAFHTGDNANAQAHYLQSLTLGEQINDVVSQLNSLDGLAEVSVKLGDTPAACDYYRRLLALMNSYAEYTSHPHYPVVVAALKTLGCGDDVDPPS